MGTAIETMRKPTGFLGDRIICGKINGEMFPMAVDGYRKTDHYYYYCTMDGACRRIFGYCFLSGNDGFIKAVILSSV